MGWPKGKPRSAETRAKISANNRGSTPAHKAAMQDAELRARLSESHKGKKQSPETRAKRSATLKARGLSPEHLAKMRAARTPEVEARRIAASAATRTGRPRPDMAGDGNPMRDPEIAAKLREAGNGRWSGTLSYDAIHSRLEHERGLASTHVCVICGKTAKDWCLIRGREQARGGSHNNAYSFDLADYVTMCHRDHRRYDRGLVDL
jgi:rubrerythrin